MRFFRWALILCVLLAGPATADESRLRAFAREVGLADIGGFVETIDSLDRTGRLPPRYLAKEEAEGLGWKPGGDLCRVAPGRSIGGDRFGNREKRLPETKGRRWYEADLDFSCGRRGAKRLVYSSDGLRFVTTDHYESFREVPR
jgi:ribonuclease T1